MKRPTAGSLVSIAAAVALTGGAGAAASTGQEMHSLDHTDLIPVLAEEQSIEDALPSRSNIAAQASLVASSSRLLAEADSGRNWVALDKRGNICVVAELDDGADGHEVDAGITGASCTTPLQFYRSGASLRLQGGPGAGVVAHLLPPDIDMAAASETIASVGAATQVEAEVRRDAPPMIIVGLDAADVIGDIEVRHGTGEVLVLPSMSKR